MVNIKLTKTPILVPTTGRKSDLRLRRLVLELPVFIIFIKSTKNTNNRRKANQEENKREASAVSQAIEEREVSEAIENKEEAVVEAHEAVVVAMRKTEEQEVSEATTNIEVSEAVEKHEDLLREAANKS